MTLSDIISILFFLVVPLSIAALAPFLLSRAVDGPRPYILLRNVIVGFLLILIIYYGSNFTSSIPRLFLLAFLLVFFSFFSGIYFNNVLTGLQLGSEDILLDLGRINGNLGLIVGAINLFLCLIYATGIFNFRNAEFLRIFFPALFALTSLWHITKSLSKAYITKQGFTQFDGPIKWEQMKGYNWGGRTDGKIRLIIIFGKRELSYHIPVELQAQVEKVFEGRVERQVANSTFRKTIIQNW